MKKFTEVVLVLAILLFTGSAVLGQANNNPPPAGAILDLSGTPIPHGTYRQYTVDFIAQLDPTTISFAFREDPSYESFTNASVTDITGNPIEGGPNLLQNGDFSQGTHTDDNGHAGTPNFWTYVNQYGASASGVVLGPNACGAYSFCWYDGAVQAYDLISQQIPTTVGHTYHISFFLVDYYGGGQVNFSELSSPTTRGINVTAYAQGGSPVVQSAQTVNVQFSPNPNPQTQIATVGDPANPAAQSLAVTLSGVTTNINVSETFFYEPTELSTGGPGVGIADGICEAGATETQDFDCRFDPTFVYQVTNGNKVVPHCIPSHNNLCVWIRVVATLQNGSPAVAGRDYAFGVDWYYAWNTNPTLAPGGSEYPAGWNSSNPQMYDRPGENVDIAFVKNITTYSKNCAPNCVGTADPGLGAHTITLNDVVPGAPPNPPAGTPLGTVEMVVPVPGISPFPYVKTLPMLVAFKLEDESTETSIANAVTPPYSVHVATLEGPNNVNVPIATPAHFPTSVTYNPTSKTYYIFLSLSSAAYRTDGTVYTLQIDSDLFQQPVNLPFVVKASQ
jgi:hypothetical protein